MKGGSDIYFKQNLFLSWSPHFNEDCFGIPFSGWISIIHMASVPDTGKESPKISASPCG